MFIFWSCDFSCIWLPRCTIFSYSYKVSKYNNCDWNYSNIFYNILLFYMTSDVRKDKEYCQMQVFYVLTNFAFEVTFFIHPIKHLKIFILQLQSKCIYPMQGNFVSWKITRQKITPLYVLFIFHFKFQRIRSWFM